MFLAYQLYEHNPSFIRLYNMVLFLYPTRTSLMIIEYMILSIVIPFIY